MEPCQYPRQYLYKRIVQAKLFIDEHYADNPDLNNISDEACFSRFHFIRLFKEIYGYTPHQYLTHVRIEHAKLLLQEGGYIADVCYTLGFSSISSFTGLFKRKTGLTPSAYQQQQSARNVAMNHKPLQYVPACFAGKRGWTEPQF